MFATDVLGSLLRNEISATLTYDQAIEKLSGKHPEGELRRLRDEHQRAADALRRHVHADDEPDSQVWGAWANFVDRTSFAEAAAFKALQEGEGVAVSEYEIALKDKDIANHCRTLSRTKLLPECRGRIFALNRLMA
jgi:hypothetical protein